MYSSQEWWNGGADAPGPSPSLIGQSLRFRGASAYLENTTITCPSTFTYSGWVKLCEETTTPWVTLMNQNDDPGGGSGPVFGFNTSHKIQYYSSAAQLLAGEALLRDPAAWYHCVLQQRENDFSIYINGRLELQSDRALTGADGPFQIHKAFNGGNWPDSDCYMSDVYFIEGQNLAPEVFATLDENGVWVPAEPNFGIAQYKYSDYLTCPGGFQSGFGPDKAFNGQVGGADNMAISAVNTDTVTFAPKTAIPFTTEIAVFSSQTDNTASWNGNSWSLASNSWESFAGSGEISASTPLTITSAGNGTVIDGIRIDGTHILTNPFLWSAKLTAPNGFAGNPPYQAFLDDGQFAEPSGVNDNMTFEPDEPIPYNELFEIALRPDGVEISVNDGPWLNPGGAISRTFRDVATGPGQIEKIDFRYDDPSSQPGLYNIRLDGKVLVDGVNNNFGTNGFHLTFSDPNDIGADTSGNGNDFTAYGIDTSYVVSGDYADPTLTTYDQGTNSVPTANGGPAYIIDIQDDLNSGTWCTFNPSGWSNGVTVGPGNTNGTYIGEPYAQFFNFDLRDFPTVTNVGIWSGWNQASSPGNAHAQLLDANKNVIAGTRVNLQRHNDFSVRYELCNTDVGARYIQFDCSQSDSTVFIYGIEVNGGLIFQGTSHNADYDVMQDSPSQNYPTINNLGYVNGVNGGNPQPAKGNLIFTSSSNSDIGLTFFTIPETGKYYFEMIPPALQEAGLRMYAPMALNESKNGTGASTDIMSQGQGGLERWIVMGGSLTPSGQVGKPTPNGNMQVAIDADNKKIYLGDGVANQWLVNGGAGTYTLGVFDESTPTVDYSTLDLNGQNHAQLAFYGSDNTALNFGQQPFVFTAPDGYEHLQSQKIESPILNGRDHFQVITAPGQGTNDNPYDPATQTAGDFTQYMFSNNATTYDSGMTTQTFFPTLPPANVFDGNPDTACNGGDGGTGNWMIFRPATPLTGVTSVTIRTNYIEEVRVNDIVTGDTAGSSIEDMAITNPPSTINQIAIKSTSAAAVQMNNIVVNGKTLVDVGILPAAKATFPNGLYWIKSRTVGEANKFVDTLRGDNELICPSTVPEAPVTTPQGDCVGWIWNAPEAFTTTGSANIQTTGYRNQEAGFSLFSYTTNNDGNNKTIAHGLGKEPKFILIKSTNQNSAWYVYHRGLGTTASDAANMYMSLNDNQRSFSDVNIWNGTPPDENNFTIGPSLNTGHEYIGYAWADIEGYSAMGGFKGNGSADGPFQYCGFKPAMVIIKSSSSSYDWFMYDTTRDVDNPCTNPLKPNQVQTESQAGSPVQHVDIFSNGFKISGDNQINQPSSEQIWVAFAENPFHYPTTAR